MDNKLAILVVLMTILCQLLSVCCQEDIDCSDYELRKPPRFGKRAKEGYNPCDNGYKDQMRKRILPNVDTYQNRFLKLPVYFDLNPIDAYGSRKKSTD